jgi:hypothetical protein
MDFKKLYHLVHFLSADQISAFGLYMKGKKKTRAWLLFTRILNQSDCDKKSEKSMRGKEFRVSSAYNFYRNQLVNLFIESLVASKTKAADDIAFIRETYLWDMQDVGYKVLVAKMLEFWENEALVELQACFDFVEDLQNYHSITIELPETVITREEFTQIRDNNRMLMRQIDRFRAAFKLPDAEKKIEARLILGSLPASDVTILNKTLRLKVLRGVAFLNGQYRRSFRLGEALAERIEFMPHKFPNIFLAKEIQLLALQSVQLDLRDKAVHYTMRLSLLEAGNLYEEAEIRAYSIKVGNYVAERYENEELTEVALMQLRENQNLFEKDMQRRLFFTLALAYYYNRKWSQAISCITSLHQVPDSNLFTWEPLLLMAICQSEANSPDYAESIFQSSLHQAQKSDLEYPVAAIRSVRRYYHAIPAERKAILEKDIAMIRAMLLNPDEKRASLAYSVDYFLNSRLTGKSIRELIAEENKADVASLIRIVDGA